LKPRTLSLDGRRTPEFQAELLARARTWLPDWGVDDAPQDFGRALLAIAARFDSEVAEQLDAAGEKTRRGFIDWLGLRGGAARPARMPVVMRTGERAANPVLARAGARLQADGGGASVTFETESDLRVTPGRLELVVGADIDRDEIFFPPPGLTSAEPVPAAPTQWLVKTFVDANGAVLQLDPDAGLAPDVLIQIGAAQYRVEKVDKDLVTIDPVLATALEAGTLVAKVESFTPFDGLSPNRQRHALYVGHIDLLNIESAATIDVVGARALADAQWRYWGKSGNAAGDGWQPLMLSDTQPLDAVRLDKPKGAIEPRGIGSVKNSRWIAAFAARVEGAAPKLADTHIHLRINDHALPSCPIVGNAPASPAAQALANSTPLVLAGTFYPLGKMPRQFDTFYLGCAEAFSKRRATVQLCVGLADPTFASFSAVRSGADADEVVAGVGEDGALHLFAVDATSGALSPFDGRNALQPPAPGFGGAAPTSPATALAHKPSWRLPVWTEGVDFRVGVAAGTHVWVWAENSGDRTKSGWLDFGELPLATPSSAVTGLVYLNDGATPRLVALRVNGTVSVREVNSAGEWQDVVTQSPAGTVVLATIATVWSNGPANEPLPTGRFVGVDAGGLLYVVDATGQCVEMQTVNISAAVQPAAFDIGGIVSAIAVRNTLAELVLARVAVAQVATALAGSTVSGGSLEAMFFGAASPVALGLLTGGSGKRLVTWSPSALAPDDVPFNSEIDSSGEPDGAPTAVAGHVIVPGRSADVLTSPLRPSQRLTVQAEFGAGVVTPSSSTPLAPYDIVAARIGGNVRLRQVSGGPITRGAETFQSLQSPFPAGAFAASPLAYRCSASGAAGLAGATLDTLALAAGERRVQLNAEVLIRVGAAAPSVYVASIIDDTNDPWVVTLDRGLPAATTPGDPVDYWPSESMQLRVAPFARMNPALATERIESAVVADRSLLFAAGISPASQRAAVFASAGSFATLVVFDAPWTQPPPPAGQFRVDASVGSWTHQASGNASNPELSWEYWNGAWSKLTVVDQTSHLESSGAVTFDVPDDIRATDWSGKSDFWVRARLVGGDYGSEVVRVRNTPQTDGSTVQTIERSTTGIKPPAVVSLSISYKTRANVLPEVLLAEDSGTVRDQSEANRTASASVEAFVPLSVMLGRLRGPPVPGDSSTAEVTTDCGGECAGRIGSAAAAPAVAAGATAVVPASGRALFLGFSAALAGASVNLLSLVAREADHDASAPMAIDALAADRFVPVAAQDDSRALGETGLLTLAFGDPPTQAELFGRALRWLRIAPAPATTGAPWSPSLAGMYLNAVWASATETLTRERVGSSEGAPGLVLRLARPPLLERSLELRVREPLGTEEREELLAIDSALVRNEPDLPGDWVRWSPVNDPADCSPDERVYALDEGSGEIRFGDGKNGRIPPIGRDNIVAFSYRRTEPPAPGAADVPANAIAARAQINLVTPVEGVEAAFAADRAAGGAPPEPDTSVLRNASAVLRHRGRALTARDFEDLARASSPRVAQVRALAARSGVRLLVAMRGDSPQPGNSQCRELERHLLALAPATLTATSLSITGPRERHLRVSLHLRVDRLEHAAAVRDECALRLCEAFDAARGGSGEGWPIGACPREQDVTRVLDKVQHLDSIASLSLAEIMDGGAVALWPPTFRADDLVRLVDGNVRATFDAGVERAP